MKITYVGHATILFETEKGSLLIDPFISGNSRTPLSVDDLPKIDTILLTHGHSDHIEDTETIARRDGSLIIAIAELATWFGWKGLRVHGMSIGGAHDFSFGTVKMTQAFHGSGMMDAAHRQIVYAGMPAGLLVNMEGKTIYHAGDTALFSDMKLIGAQNKIDLAFLPIGDNYTMGPEDALLAAEWIHAGLVVPVHYNTFPVIAQDGQAFVNRLDGQGRVLEPGQTLVL